MDGPTDWVVSSTGETSSRARASRTCPVPAITALPRLMVDSRKTATLSEKTSSERSNYVGKKTNAFCEPDTERERGDWLRQRDSERIERVSAGGNRNFDSQKLVAVSTV